MTRQQLAPHDAVRLDLLGACDGFGLRFAPLERGDIWRLRVANRAYGHQTYAPSGRFSIGDQQYRLVSAGDDLVSYRPPDFPDSVVIVAGRSGAYLEPVDPNRPTPTPRCAPDWARGCWLGGDWRGLTQRAVEADLDELVASGLSFRGRIVDYGWHAYGSSLLGASPEFPDLEAMVRRHADAGLAVVLWLAPWVPADSEQWSVFAQRGWFVVDGDGEPMVFPIVGDGTLLGSYLDLSRADVAAVWTGEIRRLVDIGVRGFKLDFGEALPSGANLGEPIAVGDEAWRSRNLFPLAMQRATVAGASPDCFILSRSGWTGSEDLVASWVGDQSSDLSRFGGLGSTLWGLQSLMASDRTFNGCDIGGYFGSPDEETFIAWQHTARLFDFAMYHGLGDRAPWRRGPAALEAHRNLAAHLEDGQHPDDHITVGWSESGHALAQRQGPSRVVVADIGSADVAAALPAGTWRDATTDTAVDGDQVVLCRPGSVFTTE